MDAMEIRVFVHGLRNSLNAAKMNAALLTPMRAGHGHKQAETIDPDALRGLDTALREAEGHLVRFHARLEAEWRSTGASG